MAHLICKTLAEYDRAYERKLARARKKTGRNVKRGLECDYLIHVCVEGEVPVFSAVHRDTPVMVGEELDLFAGHIAEAKKAMKRGRDFFRAVYFDPVG